MLAAAFAQARTPRLYLQCRHKSNLSAINRTLDQSIRRDRRKSLDDGIRTRDERGGNFPWQDRGDDRRPNNYDNRRDRDSPRSRDDRSSPRAYEGRNHLERGYTNDRPAPRTDIRVRPEDASDEGFKIRKTNKYVPNHEGDQSDHGGDIMKVPFTHKHHFTEENWNRLMDAVKRAEDKYIRALPTRPSTLPVYDNSKPASSLEIKQQLKKTFKADLATVEPTLERQRKEWLRVIQHTGEALKNAKSKNIFIPGRRWFTEDDPKSALKASVYPIQPPATPKQGADWAGELRDISVLNQDMRSEIIMNLVNRHATALMSGKNVQDEDFAPGVLGFNSRPKERDGQMDKFSAKEEKERRRLEEESRLDDEQLSSFVRNNREKNEDRKNKYKEIQEPRDRRDRDSRDRDSRDSRDRDSRDMRPSRDDRDRDAYVSIPYTTAASEFLYGLNVVIAALKAKRRKMYKLYIHSRALTNPASAKTIRVLCKQANLKWEDVDDSFLPKMDKMAQGRPHNGVILETSPLPTLPTKSLGKFGVTDMSIGIELAEQSAEEVQINGNPNSISFHYTHTWRKPLVLLLDGILDPGNLGNILRTAHFYSVDAVAICTNTCAPVNLPVVQKAASGAAEALTILSIPGPANFITTCKKHGWLVHAAVAPNAASATVGKKNLFTSSMISPLSRGPSILMIGAEGEGLRANLATKADANVGIRGVKPAIPELDVGVDSLNVGSSVAVLLEAFMRKPDNLEDVVKGTPREDDVAARIV
ncbi:unnamed protein product [Aureobasidium pullulans]|nr:unnamed protein product [Aureobasidium pullulans]